MYKGANTAHQDHVATIPQPPNFKTKNIRNKIIPIPNPLLLLFSDILYFLYNVNIRNGIQETKFICKELTLLYQNYK